MDLRKTLQSEVLDLLAAEALGDRSDIYRLMKLPFLQRHELEEREAPVPFYGHFYREEYGPISPAVYSCTHQLVIAGLVGTTGQNGRERLVTEAGRKLARMIRNSTSPEVVAKIDELAIKLRALGFNEIRQDCYKLSVVINGERTTVGSVPLGELIYGLPRNWEQVISDDALRSFQAVMEARKGGTLAEPQRTLEEL